MRINDVTDFIHQTPNLLERIWSSLERPMEKCIEDIGVLWKWKNFYK